MSATYVAASDAVNAHARVVARRSARGFPKGGDRVLIVYRGTGESGVCGGESGADRRSGGFDAAADRLDDLDVGVQLVLPSRR